MGQMRLTLQEFFFFIILYRLRAFKTLYFNFYNFMKKIEIKIERVFAKNFARFLMKKE